ncbi:MAG: HNH endonuclease [Bacteroidota bacterium]
MQQVLVLNQDYQAVSLCDPERAIVLVLMKKAELISDVAHRKMRSVRKDYLFPSIIRLRAYVKLPFKKVSLTRHNVMKRDGFQCQYCGSRDRLTLDHVIPRAQGGRTSWTNLVVACQPCNSEKGDRLPEEAGMSLRYPPFRPSFIMYLSRYTGRVEDDWKPYLLM